MLGPPQSAELRDQLLRQLVALPGGSDLLAWAKAAIPLKNTLLEPDARLVDAAFRSELEDVARAGARTADQKPGLERSQAPEPLGTAAAGAEAALQPSQPPAHEAGIAHPRSPRKRSKAHLLFVREQPCLICR